MPTFKGTDYATNALACDAMVSDYAYAGGNPMATQREKMGQPPDAAFSVIMLKDYGYDDPAVKSWANASDIEAAIGRWRSANP